jgi:hypothetical protein
VNQQLLEHPPVPQQEHHRQIQTGLPLPWSHKPLPKAARVCSYEAFASDLYSCSPISLIGIESIKRCQDSQASHRLVEKFQQGSNQLFVLGEVSFSNQMIESADCFDAMIAALAARAVYLGHYNKPTRAQLEMAKVEGWIWLPGSELQTMFENPIG